MQLCRRFCVCVHVLVPTVTAHFHFKLQEGRNPYAMNEHGERHVLVQWGVLLCSLECGLSSLKAQVDVVRNKPKFMTGLLKPDQHKRWHMHKLLNY